MTGPARKNPIASVYIFLPLVVLVAAITSCDTTQQVILSYTLRMKEVDFEQAAGQVTEAIQAALSAGGQLAEGYPTQGAVIAAPIADQPGVSQMQCSPGVAASPGHDRCILLSIGGDFISIQEVNFESEMAHIVYVYLLPRSIFARVHPASNYIGIDAYVFADHTAWAAASLAIADGLKTIGAKIYRR